MKKSIFISFFLICNTLVSAQGWLKVLPDSMTVESICADYDGGYILAGINAKQYLGAGNYPQILGNVALIKIDARGNRKWLKIFPTYKERSYGYGGTRTPITIIRSVDSAFILYSSYPNYGTFIMKKIDVNGNEVWGRNIGYFPTFPQNTVKVNKGKYIVTRPTCCPYPSSNDKLFCQYSANGADISEVVKLGKPFTDFLPIKDGYLGIRNGSMVKLDTAGNEFFTKDIRANNLIDLVSIKQIFPLKDSNYILNVYSPTKENLVKIDKLGNVIWRAGTVSGTTVYGGIYYYEFKAIALTPQDEAISLSEGGGNKFVIRKYGTSGELVWKRDIVFQKYPAFSKMISTADGGYLIVGNLDVKNTNTPFIVKINDDGFIYPNILEGQINKDFNRNCQVDSLDTPFANCVVQAVNANGDIFLASSDTAGHYSLNLNVGRYTRYTLSASPLSNKDAWQTNCTPSVSKVFTDTKLLDTLNFSLPAKVGCPTMEVNVSTPLLRRCFETYYVVDYRNNSPITATNAYVNVTIDPLLTFVGSTKRVDSVNGRTYRFNLGTIRSGDGGRFSLLTKVSCGDSTFLGQTLCVEAKIFPDTCNVSPLWSGANLVVTGNCQTDSVVFQVKNTGRAASTTVSAILIDNDSIVSKMWFQLPTNGIYTKKIPSNGHTWRMIAQQEPFHPSSSDPTAFVEGCRANNSIQRSTGFVTQFANDDKSLTRDADCQRIIGSFDPNDKIGYPQGIKSQHNIPQNQEIDYTIRFQNTGTDTAFTVVIRDTLSPFLDPTNIEFGASSHAYTAEIYGKGILKFTFDNILLVDSFKNEPKSHGFIQYRIKQKQSVAYGSEIFNSAGIYFDFNEPVITNRTLHTVSKDVVSAIFYTPIDPNFRVKVAPNPFSEKVVFELPEYKSPLTFELLDMNGQVIRKEKVSGVRHECPRDNLPSGIYLFRFSTENNTLSVGKLIVL